jgi:NAD(P)-dependent dehydrogenase (short-subunit alcohol dehydrogenase family)
VLAIVAARTLNRVGHRLFVDRQARRRIDWRRHVVVISGGARGIGGGVAERLADRGAKVVTLDMAERTAHSRETRHFKADVTDEAQLLEVRERIHKELGMVT